MRGEEEDEGLRSESVPWAPLSVALGTRAVDEEGLAFLGKRVVVEVVEGAWQIAARGLGLETVGGRLLREGVGATGTEGGGSFESGWMFR